MTTQIRERLRRPLASESALLGASASRGLVARQLLQLPSTIGTLSLMSDGRIGATDWSTGDLVLVDPASGSISRVVEGDIEKAAETWAEDPLLSPDHRHLAYQWFGSTPKERAGALRVLSMEKGATPRTVVADPTTVTNIVAVAWSKDSTSLLVCYEKPVPLGGTAPAGRGDFELAWVTVDRGGITPLKTFEWWRSGVGSLNSIGTVSLSPDGRRIAYSVPDRQGASDRSIFVMRADGSDLRRVVSGGVNDQPIWTPDGSRLIFLSNRSGDPALWSVAVDDNRENTTQVIKTGMGRTILHGVLASGALMYFGNGTGPADCGGVRSASRVEGDTSVANAGDSERSRAGVVARRPPSRLQASHYRPWECRDRDGCAYGDGRTANLCHRGRATSGTGRPTWHPDGTVQAIGRSGVRLKVGTALEEVVTATLPMEYVSPDGRTLYAAARDAGIEMFDASNGSRTGSIALPNTWRPAALSPDGRSFALIGGNTGQPAMLAVIGVDGRGFRQLPSSFSGATPDSVRWTRDGTALFVEVDSGNDVSSIQRVPISGGQPVTIATKIVGLRSFDISPDERRIAYSIDRPSTDVWMLDLNAVPEVSALNTDATVPLFSGWRADSAPPTGQGEHSHLFEVSRVCAPSYSDRMATIGCTAAARRAEGMPASAATTNAVAAASE